MVLNSSLQQLKLNEAARPKRVKPIVDVDHLFSNNSQVDIYFILHVSNGLIIT